jgi:hypothetical protein
MAMKKIQLPAPTAFQYSLCSDHFMQLQFILYQFIPCFHLDRRKRLHFYGILATQTSLNLLSLQDFARKQMQ